MEKLFGPIVHNFERKGEPMMSFAAFQPSDLHFAESESGVKKWVVDARNFD